MGKRTVNTSDGASLPPVERTVVSRPHPLLTLNASRSGRGTAVRWLLGLAGLVMLATWLLPTAGPLTADEASAATVTVDPNAEAQFVSLLNDLRVSRGLPPLSVDDELTAAARQWSDTMRLNGGIFHTADQSAGISQPWVLLGENVGTGPNVTEVFDAFVASPTHYANLTNPDFDYIGIGVIWDGPRLWTTQRFRDEGAPAPTSPPTTSTPPATAAPTPAPTTTAAPTATAAPTTTASPTTTEAPTTTPARARDTGEEPPERIAQVASDSAPTPGNLPRRRLTDKQAPPPNAQLVAANARVIADLLD